MSTVETTSPPSSSRAEPRPARSVVKERRKFAIPAAFGSLLIGVSLPCILVTLHLSLRVTAQPLYSFFSLQLIALIFCGPGAILLAIGLHFLLIGFGAKWSLQRLVISGACGGAFMAFWNLPGYLALFVITDGGRADDTVASLLRLGLLFAVAGASSGMWIAWQAWRAFHPHERLFPRFTLRTLMMVVLLWGAAMLAFQPSRDTAQRHSSWDD